MVFSNNVPESLGVGIVQQQLAETFQIGYLQKVLPATNINPFIADTLPKFSTGETIFILSFNSVKKDLTTDKQTPLGIDDASYISIEIPYGNTINNGDQFILYVNGEARNISVVDTRSDLSGILTIFAKEIDEFLFD
jgi:hypothetical protein